MADFRETMYVTQVDHESYSYCWEQVDLASEELMTCDWDQCCSAEDLYDALEAHGFDTDRVFNYFEDYPFSSITLEDEY